MSKDPRQIVLRPIVSEKSYSLLDGNVYTFVVAKGANKVEIRQAVEDIFDVRVAGVRTLNRKGKRKRDRKTGTWGHRSSHKRALVTLAAGERSIDLFGS